MQFFILKKLYVLLPILLLELLPLFLSFSFVRFRVVLLRIILFRDSANFFGLGKHGKLLDSFQKIVVRYRQLVLDHLARVRQLAILLWHGMIVLIVVLHGINHYILVQAYVPIHSRVTIISRMLVLLPIDPGPIQLDRPISILRWIDDLSITSYIVVVEHRSIDACILIARATSLRDRAGKSMIPVAKNVRPYRRLNIIVIVVWRN